MGAIAGVRPQRRETAREELIEQVQGMRRAMASRAPIEGGMAVAYDASIALAHGGSRGPAGESVLQPLVDESGTLWLVADGEPSNADELRLELVGAGHEFRSACGAEVIVHLYEQGGIGALERLSGSFAFALWDRERQELLLGRDRFGSRPLYLTEREGVVSFASEVRALHGGPAADPAGLVAFLTLGYLPEPVTVHDGVRAVRAGTIVRVRGGRCYEERFWEEASELPSGDPGTDDAHLGQLLRDTVEASITGEEPIGVAVEDDVASRALLALVQPLLGRGIRTHAFRFTEAYGRRASTVGRGWLGIEHREHVVTPAVLDAALAVSAEEADQPSMGSPLSLLAAKAMRVGGERVWLSTLATPGLLGLGSMRGASWLWWAGRRMATRTVARTGLRALGRLRPFGRAARMAGYFDHLDSVGAAYLTARGLLVPEGLATVLRPDVWQAATDTFDAVAHLDGHVQAPVGPPCMLPPRSAEVALHRALSAIELGGPVISGALRDAEGMATAYGLSMRTPFLDHRLFEWVTTGAASDDGAPLLRVVGSALQRGAPGTLAEATPPIEEWMRGPLRTAMEDRLFADDPDGLFARDGVEDLWASFLSGHVGWRPVWALTIARGWMAARRARIVPRSTSTQLPKRAAA